MAGNQVKVNGALHNYRTNQIVSKKACLAVHRGVLLPCLQMTCLQKKHEHKINNVKMRTLRRITGIMSLLHEGEVVLKEKFGSTGQETLFVKPQGQDGTVIVNTGNKADTNDWILTLFLPQGYPDSVSKDYISYQIWDTAQAFCSTITGILATQEVLRGVGVGDVSATPLAATITWIFKDGCGHVGKILFACSHGSYLDAYSKKWRIYADILNNAAMCIEIALPRFKFMATFALCVSSVMKAVVGVAGGATRIAMTQHHAIKGNLADVSAKDAAQETAVNLVASITALGILAVLGNSLSIFMLMMILHVMFNYLAVRAVCLRTLNEPRFLLLIDQYLRNEVITSPCEINKSEPIIFYQLGPCILDLKITGFRILLGQSLKTVFNEIPTAAHLQSLCKIYIRRNYILIPNLKMRTMHVVLKGKAKVDDVLCAYFHTCLLAMVTCAINDEYLTQYKIQEYRPFAQVCRTLQSAEWSRYESHTSDSKFPYDPSYDLMKYLDKIVQKEWPRIRAGLSQTGWDLSKHLLICDEWRVQSTNITTEIHQEHFDEQVQCDFGSMTETAETVFEEYFELIEPEPQNLVEAEGKSTTLSQKQDPTVQFVSCRKLKKFP